MSTDHIQSLKTVLVKAQSNDNLERNENEQKIKDMMAQDIKSLIGMLMMIVNEAISEQQDSQSQKEGKSARTLAAILFKNALYMGVFGENMPTQHGNSPWYQLDKETRDHIKEALLTSLGSQGEQAFFENKDYMKDLCLCISSIATIEIPRGEWDGFVTVMADQADQNQQQFFKFAGIYNLGLVMDILEPNDLQQSDYIRIWDSMIANIDPTKIDLARIVSQAICRLSVMSDLIFQSEEHKQKIMKGISDLCKIQDYEVVQNSLQALIEIAKLNYECMDLYLNMIYQISEKFLTNVGKGDDEDDNLARLSIEVWNSLCEVEIERMKHANVPQLNIIKNSDWNKLGNLFCLNIMHTGFEVTGDSLDDANDQTISLACCTGLNFIAQIIQDEFLPFIFDFVQQYINHVNQSGQKNWITDYVSILAFNTALDGPSSQKIQEAFENHLDYIYQNSQHQEARVRSCTSRLLGQLASTCPQLFCSSQQAYQNFCGFFKQNSVNQHPQIIIFTIQAMQNLYVQLQASPIYNVSILNGSFNDIITIGINATLDVKMIDGGHIIPIQDAVSEITQCCDHESLKTDLQALGHSVVSLIGETILGQGSQYSGEQQEYLVNGLAGLLQVIIARLEQSHFDQELQQKVLNLIQMLGQQNSLRQAMFLILNGTINSMNEDQILGITKDVLAVSEETIIDAVQQEYKYDQSCRRFAVGIVEDIITGLKDKASIYMDTIMPFLNKVLESPELTTDVKTFGIGAIGDLCLMCESQFMNYLPATMTSLILAGQMSLQPIDNNLSIEDKQHIHDLRHILCDAFINILNGIQLQQGQQQMQGQSQQAIQEHINNMFFYIEGLTCSNDLQVTPELAKQIMDLYCDIAQHMGNVELIQDPFQKEQAQTFSNTILRSQIRNNIQNLFGPLQQQIQNNQDGGQETVERYGQQLNGIVVQQN